MSSKSKVGFSAYCMTPLMTLLGFTIASFVFTFILKEPSPVPVFIIFAVIQITCMSLYALLPGKGKTVVRIISMFLVGSFILVLAGMMGRINFQLEGFFFYLTTGTLSGVMVHFIMGKLIGPIFFSRSWCSWGCWTGMVLDLLPYKENTPWKKGVAPYLRFIHFFISLTLVAILFYGFKFTILQTDKAEMAKGIGTMTELTWFLAGNIIYYGIGISLALILKDNRAFCKYICPLTVFLKTINRVTLMRIKGDQEKCTDCGTCVQKCPMGISINKYVQLGERVKSTECILCMNCVAHCPEGILSSSVGLDFATKDYLNHDPVNTSDKALKDLSHSG